MGHEHINICISEGKLMTDTRLISTANQKVDVDFWRNVIKLNTSIPAIIDEFDPATQRVSATPAIMGKYVKPDNTVEYIQCPKITNIPLAIIKGAGLKLTYPVVKGENCTLIFSQRSIDNFILEGGIQRPFDGDDPTKTTLRCMDMTDAMCFPGLITNKETITNYATDAIELRNSEGDVKVSVKRDSLTLKQDSAKIELSEGNITMSAATINITGTTSVNIMGVDFLTHIHTGGTIQGKTGAVDTGGGE